MSHNKNNRVVHDKRDLGDPVELEQQFVLRMPEEPARVLREAIRSGVTNLKDRFTIQLENDMRYGEVRVDHFLMHAKVVDLPTIVESLKTIDNKSFYKTADICQMMICKEEPDIASTDEESPAKNKKKDPNKVDKKFLWPHGVTPPTKNVRRRRFRKTLKKKYVEAPEIEKEVKRLLREDNDAVSVKWEIISEDDDQIKQENSSGTLSNDLGTLPKEEENEVKTVASVKSRPSSKTASPNKGLNLATTARDLESPDDSAPRLGLVEHDIFGGAVSDSEEEDANMNMDIDDTSRITADVDESTMNDSNSLQAGENDSDKLVTSFSSEMFQTTSDSSANNKVDVIANPNQDLNLSSIHSINPNINETMGQNINYNDGNDHSATHSSPVKKPANEMRPRSESSLMYMKNYSGGYLEGHLSTEELLIRIEEVQEQLRDLQGQRTQKQREVENMENAALRQRFQEMLQSLEEQIQMKEIEYESLQSVLARN